MLVGNGNWGLGIGILIKWSEKWYLIFEFGKSNNKEITTFTLEVDESEKNEVN